MTDRPDTVPNKKAWERLDDETPAAFAGFLHYLDLGPHRTLTKAYALYLRDQGKEKRANAYWNDPSKRATGSFRGWSAEYDWVERARQYDAHMQGKAREAAVDDQVQHIVEYSRRLRIMASGMNAQVVKGLQVMAHRLDLMLKEVQADDTKNPIPVEKVPQFLRAFAAIGGAAIEAEAMGLGVHDVLAILDPEDVKARRVQAAQDAAHRQRESDAAGA